MRKFIIATVGALALVFGLVGIAAQPAAAVSTDPVPSYQCDSTVIHLGETLHCVVVGTAGYTPSNSIRYTNPLTHKTINVWNGQYQTFNVTYTPSASEVGRTETLIATIYLPAEGHIVRSSSGSIAFQVVAAGAAAPAPPASFYTNCGTGFTHTNESAWATCHSGGGPILSWQGWVVCSFNPGTKYYGPRVAGINFSSQVWCPAGVVIQNGGLWYL